MVKAAISAAAMTALQVLAAERALTIGGRVAEMQVVSSDATASQLKLGFK